MPRPQLERITYSPVRDLLLTTKTTDTPPPNCWTLEHDRKERVRAGKYFSLHKNERTYEFMKTNKSASATDYYTTDQGSKMSLAHKVQRSPSHYLNRTEKRSYPDGAYLGEVHSTPNRVGPGAYGTSFGVLEHQMPRADPGARAAHPPSRLG